MTHVSNMLLYRLLASGFLSCFKKHHVAHLPETIKYTNNFFLYLKVKIYQLQVPENKSQLLIFMPAITPVQLCQECQLWTAQMCVHVLLCMRAHPHSHLSVNVTHHVHCSSPTDHLQPKPAAKKQFQVD